jgi:hypothetical protein
LFKICQNFAAQLPGHSPFYSTFSDVYGRNIGQLTTLAEAAGREVTSKSLITPLSHCCQMAEFWAAGLKNGPVKRKARKSAA